ncbi:hypothetical protein [Corynebacterium auriscanis]|uniref:hypothetical protein n=1 Tax=Corynebacterium auriscanis TaxID=99807 RepID=UPI0024AD4400|nr:hypothetical protein [Corynebacterium auriscanis]
MAYLRVQGAKRLRRTLKQAGVDVKQLKAVNKEAADIVVPVAIGTAPVGGPYRSRGRGRARKPGRLKNSIRSFATQRAGVVRAGSAARVPYAGPVHWGWPKQPGRQGSGIRANPWISVAAKATEPAWTKAYERKVREVINSVKGK